MVSNSPELSLDLSPPVSRSDPDFLTRFQLFEDIDLQELQKPNDFISRLEDEVNKIKAFKRELPLSFLLLNNAIDKLKDEARKQAARQKEGKLDGAAGANLGNDQFEKKSWMSSAQLWSPLQGAEDEDNDQSQQWQPCKYGRDTEASRLSPREEEEEEEEGTLPGLSLVTPGLKTPAATEPLSGRGGAGEILSGSVYYTPVNQTENKLPYQTTKKRRRCWSPELHRRFVDALEKLGGCQVATPKQIRELMKVDGLSNDEVKSHLQKYRLHVRKLPAASGMSPSLSNDIAMGQDRLGLGSSKMDLLQSSSPKGPLHLGRSGKCNSSSMEDDHDNDNNNNDDNSDSHSWNVRHRM